jgi:sporulation inhibitor KapD
MIISGRIKNYDEEQRILSLVWKRKIMYFYIQRSLQNQVGKYIEENRFIQFVTTKNERIYKQHKVLTIDYVKKIMFIRYRKNIVYYDHENIKNGTKELINKLQYKLFLDLEMSMHPYRKNPNFKQEIIQVGYLLVDPLDNIIKQYNQVITPTIHKKLSKRTLKFLEITQEDVDNGISFKQFYMEFKEVIRTYKPGIVVWGRNDFLALKEAYKINKLPSLEKQTRYINLLKLHKNYFNLKNDLGLFNALALYHPHENKQSHNAYEDAFVTYQIFKGFQKVLNNRFNVNLSAYKNHS